MLIVSASNTLTGQIRIRIAFWLCCTVVIQPTAGYLVTNHATKISSRDAKRSKMILKAEDPYHDDSLFLNEIEAARIQYEALIGPLMFTTTETPMTYGAALATTTPLSSSPAMNGVASSWSFEPFPIRTNQPVVVNMQHHKESMKENSICSSPKSSATSHRPLLTDTGRKRRLIEIQLLESLVDTDDAIDELMSLWMHGECPSDVSAQTELMLMEESKSSSAVRSTTEIEQTLRSIVHKTQYLWVEPMNRLALLLFLQGNYEECQELVTAVLHEKPWHFEALHLQLLLALATIPKNYTAQRKSLVVVSDRSKHGSALEWARKGLPPLHHTKSRAMWVSNAIQQAKEILNHLEDDSYQIRHNNEYDPSPPLSVWQ